MNISELNNIYRNVEVLTKHPPRVHYVSSEKVEKLNGLNYQLYKEIKEYELSPVWHKFAYIIYTYICGLKLPISPKVIYNNFTRKSLLNIQKDLNHSCQNLDNVFRDKFDQLRQLLMEVSNVEESQILNKTLEVLSFQEGEVGLAVVDKFLSNDMPEIENIYFRKSSQIKDIIFNGKLFIYDTPQSLELKNRGHLIRSPISKDINFILYDFEKIEDFDISKIGEKSIKLLKSNNVHGHFKHDFIKLETSLYDICTSNIKTSENVNEKVIDGLPCIVGGRSIIYLELDKKYPFANFSSDNDFLCKDVIKISGSAINQDSLLIITTSGGGDQIEPIANELIGIKHLEYRRSQKLWKNKLRERISEFGTLEVSEILKRHGALTSNEVNVRNWASNYTIGPEKEEDLKAIIEFLFNGTPYKEFLKIIKLLRRFHTQAGHKIHAILKDKIYDMSLKSVFNEGRMVIKDENSSAEKMILLITEVKRPEKINRALCNKLFELSEFEC